MTLSLAAVIRHPHLDRLELALVLLEADRPTAASLELAAVAHELPGPRGIGHEHFDFIRRELARGQVETARRMLGWFTQGFAGRVLQ